MSNTNYEVVVIGGGVAGVCAAVTSARIGMRTLLVEQRGSLGGTATAGFQRYICGLYANDPADRFKILNPGISEEIIDRLDQSLPGDNRVTLGKVEVHSFDFRQLPQLFSDLANAEKNLDILTATALKDVTMVDNRIQSLKFDNGSTVSPRAVIDSSGNGAAIQLCNAAAAEPTDAEHQLSGYSIFVDGITSDDDQLQVAVTYTTRKGAESNEIDKRLQIVTFSQGIDTGTGIVRMNISREDIKPNEEHDLASELHAFLKCKMNEFADSVITDRSPCLLDRDGPVLEGRRILTTTDITQPSPCDNSAARCAWPIEFWRKGKGPSYLYQKPGTFYHIPEACLVSNRIANLYAAGRCISSSLEALASCRTVGTCMALGESASTMVYNELNKETK